MLHESVVSDPAINIRQTERQMLTMIDSWIHLSEEDIYRLELEGMDELKNKMKSSERSTAYTSGI